MAEPAGGGPATPTPPTGDHPGDRPVQAQQQERPVPTESEGELSSS